MSKLLCHQVAYHRLRVDEPDPHGRDEDILLPTLLQQRAAFHAVPQNACPTQQTDHGLQATTEVDDHERDFWCQITNEVTWIGRCTWGSMPITFILSWYGAAFLLYPFVFIKFLIATRQQYAIQTSIINHLRQTRPHSAEMAAVDKASHDGWRAEWTICDMTCIVVVFIQNLATYILQFFEAIDPDMDAMTPGNTKQALHPNDEVEFSEQLTVVPLVGPTVAHLGLPWILTIGMVIISIWQIYLFEDKRISTLERARRLDWWGFYYYGLYSFADCGNLLDLASFIKILWLSVDEEVVAFGGFRTAAYRSRVPEVVFEGWFTVSALASVMDQPVPKVAPVLFSVTTSLAASIHLFVEMALTIVPYRRHYRRDFPNVPWYQDKLVGTIALMVFHAVGYGAIFARLLGIWSCRSHDARLSNTLCEV